MESLRDIIAEVEREHRAVIDCRRDALEHARRAGDKLLVIKRQLGHGRWLAFITEQIPSLSIRTVQNYARVAKHWTLIAANAQSAAHLSIEQALQIIRVPPLDEPRSVRAPKVEWQQLSAAERREVWRIGEEMEHLSYVARTFNPPVNGRGGDVQVVGGCGGANVFHDILGGNPDSGRTTFRYTRKQVRERIERFRSTDHKRSVVSDLVVDVVRRRMSGDPTVRKPELPPSAGDVSEPIVIADGPVTSMTPAQRNELAELIGQYEDAETLLAALREGLKRRAAESDGVFIATSVSFNDLEIQPV